jgi:hypothetical protein
MAMLRQLVFSAADMRRQSGLDDGFMALLTISVIDGGLAPISICFINSVP